MKLLRIQALLLVTILFLHPFIAVKAVFATDSGSNGVVLPIVENNKKESRAVVQVSHKTKTRVVQFVRELTSEEMSTLESEFSVIFQKRKRGKNKYVITPKDESRYQKLMEHPLVEAGYNNDTYKISQQSVDWGITKMNGEAAWENAANYSGENVVIGLIDTGVDFTHPDLADVFLPGGYDFVNDDADPTDDQGHGTAMAGAIASVDNSIGFKGIAYSAKILPFKVCNSSGDCDSVSIAEGIDAAVLAGVDVINLSLGGSANALIQSAVQAATDAGIIVVAAAGNGGTEGCLYPAGYENVVCVGSTDNTDAKAGFSNYGANLDVMTPGVDISTTLRGGGYGAVSGTSISTAYYSGVAGIVKGMVDEQCTANPGLSVCPDKRAYILSLLNTTTIRDLGAAGYDTTFGNGVLDLSQIYSATAVTYPSPINPVKKGVTYTQNIEITNNSTFAAQINSCTVTSKNTTRTQTAPAFSISLISQGATQITSISENTLYSTVTFDSPVAFAAGATVPLSATFTVHTSVQPNDIILFGVECAYDQTGSPETESYRTSPTKTLFTADLPTTLTNVYFTFGRLRYGKTFTTSQLRSWDMVYLKNYDPKKIKVTQFFLYDYVKKGNQGFTKIWKSSTSLSVRTNYLLPTKRKYAYIMEFQDIATGIKVKKYFVFYTK